MPRTRTPREPRPSITREILIQVVLDGIAHAGDRRGRPYGTAFTAAVLAAAIDGIPAPELVDVAQAERLDDLRQQLRAPIRLCAKCDWKIVDPEEVPDQHGLCRWCGDFEGAELFAACQSCRRSMEACLRLGHPCCPECGDANTHPRRLEQDSPFDENGDWWTCPIHQGAITQDCDCPPVLARDDVGKALAAVMTEERKAIGKHLRELLAWPLDSQVRVALTSFTARCERGDQ